MSWRAGSECPGCMQHVGSCRCPKERKPARFTDETNTAKVAAAYHDFAKRVEAALDDPAAARALDADIARRGVR